MTTTPTYVTRALAGEFGPVDERNEAALQIALEKAAVVAFKEVMDAHPSSRDVLISKRLGFTPLEYAGIRYGFQVHSILLAMREQRERDALLASLRGEQEEAARNGTKRGKEAEQLRRRIELMRAATEKEVADLVHGEFAEEVAQKLSSILDDVDARDSLSYLKAQSDIATRDAEIARLQANLRDAEAQLFDARRILLALREDGAHGREWTCKGDIMFDAFSGRTAAGNAALVASANGHADAARAMGVEVGGE